VAEMGASAVDRLVSRGPKLAPHGASRSGNGGSREAPAATAGATRRQGEADADGAAAVNPVLPHELMLRGSTAAPAA
jgi:hypothetical protein